MCHVLSGSRKLGKKVILVNHATDWCFMANYHMHYVLTGHIQQIYPLHKQSKYFLQNCHKHTNSASTYIFVHVILAKLIVFVICWFRDITVITSTDSSYVLVVAWYSGTWNGHQYLLLFSKQLFKKITLTLLEPGNANVSCLNNLYTCKCVLIGYDENRIKAKKCFLSKSQTW